MTQISSVFFFHFFFFSSFFFLFLFSLLSFLFSSPFFLFLYFLYFFFLLFFFLSSFRFLSFIVSFFLEACVSHFVNADGRLCSCYESRRQAQPRADGARGDGEELRQRVGHYHFQIHAGAKGFENPKERPGPHFQQRGGAVSCAQEVSCCA